MKKGVPSIPITWHILLVQKGKQFSSVSGMKIPKIPKVLFTLPVIMVLCSNTLLLLPLF